MFNKRRFGSQKGIAKIPMFLSVLMQWFTCEFY